MFTLVNYFYTCLFFYFILILEEWSPESRLDYLSMHVKVEKLQNIFVFNIVKPCAYTELIFITFYGCILYSNDILLMRDNEK